jgi:hypothetical protein
MSAMGDSYNSKQVRAMDEVRLLRDLKDDCRAVGWDGYIPAIEALEAENAALRTRVAELESGGRTIMRINSQLEQETTGQAMRVHELEVENAALRALLEGRSG